jgi:hypothetical protein
MKLEETYDYLKANDKSIVELELKKISIEEDIAVLEAYIEHFNKAKQFIDNKIK